MRRSLYAELYKCPNDKLLLEKINSYDLSFLNSIVGRFGGDSPTGLAIKVIKYLLSVYSHDSDFCIEGDDFNNTKLVVFAKEGLQLEDGNLFSSETEENEDDQDDIDDDSLSLPLVDRVVYLKDPVFAGCVYDYLYYQNMREFTELMAKKQFYSDLVLSVMAGNDTFDQRKKNSESLRQLADDIRNYEQMVLAKIGIDNDAEDKFKATKTEMAAAYKKSGRKRDKAYNSLELEDYVDK